jgi:two-component system sensor histidine kinase KdpD
VLRKSATHDTLVLGVALAGVLLAVPLLRLIPHVNPTTAGLALLLIVLSTASLGSLWTAIIVSVAGALALNFFFLPPVGTLSISDPQNWVALVAFLSAALIASNLSAAAQARADIAVERAQLIVEREAAERQRQRGELASTLLASIAHDLKTPLTAIRVAVENLGTELPAADRRAQADAAIAELVRLTRLFEDLLDMARIDAAAINVQREWVTPADIVDDAAAHVRHSLEGHAMRIDAEADRSIHIDARLASIALSHLLENAARYSPASREIVVEARVDTTGFTATVTDQGPGLDPGEVEHLFERFFRGRHAQHVVPGTGMGLAISRGLVTAIGGRVWAENAPSGGARFLMNVPADSRPLEVSA